MKRSLAVVFVVCFLAATPYSVRAHGGGLNRDGCHRETATGGRHCHREKSDDRKTWETVGHVAAGLAGVALLLWVWKGKRGIAIRPTDPGFRFTPAHKDRVGAFLAWKF